MTGYITKYALTEGIIETDIETFADHPTMAKAPNLGVHACFHRKEWHLTRADAVIEANAMRDRKIASLRKTLKKLEALVFA